MVEFLEILDTFDTALSRKQLVEYYTKLNETPLQMHHSRELNALEAKHSTTIRDIHHQYNILFDPPASKNTPIFYLREEQLLNWVEKYYGFRPEPKDSKEPANDF